MVKLGNSFWIFNNSHIIIILVITRGLKPYRDSFRLFSVYGAAVFALDSVKWQFNLLLGQLNLFLVSGTKPSSFVNVH